MHSPPPVLPRLAKISPRLAIRKVHEWVTWVGFVFVFDKRHFNAFNERTRKLTNKQITNIITATYTCKRLADNYSDTYEQMCRYVCLYAHLKGYESRRRQRTYIKDEEKLHINTENTCLKGRGWWAWGLGRFGMGSNRRRRWDSLRLPRGFWVERICEDKRSTATATSKELTMAYT